MDLNRSRKRKNNKQLCNTLKKRKVINNDIDWNKMISASSIRNYMLDDPLLDWLKYYSIKDINSIPQPINHNNTNNNNNNFLHNIHTQFIMEEGLKFESIVYDKLKELAKDNYTIEYINSKDNVRSIELFNKTVEMMNKGIDIIYQGVLHDYKNSLYGSPDLLIRTDKFNKIFNKNFSIETFPIGKKDKYYYVIVDIKHSTLTTNSNNTNLQNTNSIPAYKGQILIYNKILNEIQNYMPRYGFILGKTIIYTKNNITYTNNNFMENIAVIDYKLYDDNYNIKVNNAIEWIKRMRIDGINWKLFPRPSVKELYPNMKNDKDGVYRKIKLEISDKIHEITSIWWCGFKYREKAHSKNIYSWKDKKLTASVMDFKSDSCIAKTIDYILDMNRNKSHSNIRIDDLIKTNNWRKNDDFLEIYIDFETLNGNIGQVEFKTEFKIGFIFMAGIGWEENNEFKYKSFILENNTDIDEYNMISNMWKFIENKKKELNKKEIKLIHYTNAEINFYKIFKNKHNKVIDINNFNRLDLHKVFLDNNVIVRGALNFSLKTIVKAMNKHKMIETKWDNDMNGLNAMMLAYNIYNSDKVNIDNDIMRDIEKYNMIDCKSMWDILLYLRTNY